MTTTFLVPYFNKSDKNKINSKIDVPSEHVLVKSSDSHSLPVPAIASEGFPAKQDGTYIYVTKIEKMAKFGAIHIGFTSSATFASSANIAFCGLGISGVCLYLYSGGLYGGAGDDSVEWEKHFLDVEITDKATEVISILKISNKGTKTSIQYLIDGMESPVHELANSDFENKKSGGGDIIFPCLSLSDQGQKVECIAFGQVKSRSPKIDKLMREFTGSTSTKTQLKKAAKKPKSVKKTVKKTNKKTNKKKAPAKKKTSKKAPKTTKKAGKKIAKK